MSGVRESREVAHILKHEDSSFVYSLCGQAIRIRAIRFERVVFPVVCGRCRQIRKAEETRAQMVREEAARVLRNEKLRQKRARKRERIRKEKERAARRAAREAQVPRPRKEPEPDPSLGETWREAEIVEAVTECLGIEAGFRVRAVTLADAQLSGGVS